MAPFIFPVINAHHADINGHHLIIGPFTGGFISTDALGAHIFRYCEGKTIDDCKHWVQESYGKHQTIMVDRLAGLVNDGYLNPLCTDNKYDNQDPPHVTAVMLCLTHRCQMACSYCFARENRESTNMKDMDYNTACNAIQYFLDQLIGTTESLTIIFSSSGEGLLVQDLMLQVASYGKQYANAMGVPIFFYCLTNGLMFDMDAMERLWEANINISLSWDGPPEIHNMQRILSDGTGTYDIAYRTFKTILSFGKYHPMVISTATGLNPDIPGIFRHLFENGVRSLIIKPVRNGSSDLGVSEHTLAAFKTAYTNLANLLLVHDVYQTERLYTLLTGDYFMRFVQRIAGRQFGIYRCPAAKSIMTVDANGDIYACQDFVGMTDYKLGDVFDGINDTLRRPYLDEFTCEKLNPCSDCWARYWCGGGCPSQCVKMTGTLHTPYEPECELTKHLIELAAYFSMMIETERPGLLDYVFSFRNTEPIPEPRPSALCYKVSTNDMWSRPLDYWKSPDPIIFDESSRAGGTGKRNDSKRLNASIHLRWDQDSIYMMAEVQDDIPYPPPSLPSEWWFYDSVQIAFDPNNDGGYSVNLSQLTGDDREFGIAQINGSAVCFDCHTDRFEPTSVWIGTVDRLENLLIYRMAIPWKYIMPSLPVNSMEFGFTVVVNDFDGKYWRCYQWTPGISSAKMPIYFGLLKLV